MNIVRPKKLTKMTRRTKTVQVCVNEIELKILSQAARKHQVRLSCLVRQLALQAVNPETPLEDYV